MRPAKMSKPKPLGPPPEVDESKFVSEMFIPMLQVTHYDNDTINEIARFVKEKFGLSSSLIKTYDCLVVAGVVKEREPMKWEK